MVVYYVYVNYLKVFFYFYIPLTLTLKFHHIYIVLIQRYEPELCYHFLQINVKPLKIAFPWIQHAFVGFLEVEQVLHLWDRILAYGSRGLELLPILATSMFIFRKHDLMIANSQDEVNEILNQTSHTKLLVVQLLQCILWNM